jgi:hypothetical protein
MLEDSGNYENLAKLRFFDGNLYFYEVFEQQRCLS